MLLRSITQHVRDQNWFAVFLDFLIVVVGILIAFQITNWNKDRDNQREFQLALERLHDETLDNLAVLDSVDAEMAIKLGRVPAAIDALQSCEHTENNVALIENGLRSIVGTMTIHIKMSALDELTSAPSLLAQQPLSMRDQLSTSKFNLEVLKTEADFAESLPFRDRPETSSQLTLRKSEASGYQYNGIDIPNSKSIRYSLTLANQVDEACHDDNLLKSFWTWHRFQGNIPNYFAAMRLELEKILEITGPLNGRNVP